MMNIARSIFSTGSCRLELFDIGDWLTEPRFESSGLDGDRECDAILGRKLISKLSLMKDWLNDK